MKGRPSLRKQDMDRRRGANQGGELTALNNIDCTKHSIYDVLTPNQPFWSKVSSDPLLRLIGITGVRSLLQPQFASFGEVE